MTMKKIIYSIGMLVSYFCLMILFVQIVSAADGLPVFPGAMGFGTNTKAGRGGQIIRVTNLNATGGGSLKAAVNGTWKGPRTVIFEVGGTIKLTDNLIIVDPYITVAGQTAPEPGIMIKGAGISIRTHDVLLQHLRVRVGDLPDGNNPDNRDALYIEDIPDEDDVYNVVVDHCSFSWAIDENVSLWYKGVRDVTISNCIISECLNDSLHSKGPHSKGLIVGYDVQNISIIRNLLAHNFQRNPLLAENSGVILVNNLIYDWRDLATHYRGRTDSLPAKTSIVGNVFLPGTLSRNKPIYLFDQLPLGTKIYLSDNYAPDKVGTDEMSIVELRATFNPVVASAPIWRQDIHIISSSDVESYVLGEVGATPYLRDEVDVRIINDVKNKVGQIIDSEIDVGGWPVLVEKHRSLSLPVAPNEDEDDDGYTNLEEWLFDFTVKNTDVTPPTSLKILE